MNDLVSLSDLSGVIDDYLRWFTAWHRLTVMEPSERHALHDSVAQPDHFAAWREASFTTLTQDQPAIEKIVATQDKLHTLVRLVLMKTPSDHRIASGDDDSIVAAYNELLHGLRRLEGAFSTAASGLDPLTGLRSRDGLWHEIESESKRFARTGRAFCIGMMDIDHFKKINDSYGHDAGDRVLASIADMVSRNLRAHDEAFRFGGEEFLLCLKETDLAGGLHVLERLREQLMTTPIKLASGVALTVTASFGLVVSSEVTTPTELLRRADAALYRAKQEGRNRIITADNVALIEAKA